MTGKEKYFKTGFSDLDKLIKIKENQGALITIAGRPYMGKTAFALSLVEKFVQAKKKILYFSLEYSTKQIVNRLLSISSEVGFDKIKNNTVSQRDMQIITKKTIEYAGSDLYIDDTPCCSIENIKKTTEKYNSEIIIIDFLQLMDYRPRNKKRKIELNNIMKKLKKFASEKGIVIFLLSMTSKRCEYREDKRPLISDNVPFYDIGKYSDIVIFIYRDEYYKKPYRELLEARDIEQAELIVSENKYGKIGIVYVKIDPVNTEFFSEKIRKNKIKHIRDIKSVTIKTTAYNDINLKKWRDYENVCTNTFWNKDVDAISQLLIRYTKPKDNVLIVGSYINLPDNIDRKIIHLPSTIEKNKKVQFMIVRPNCEPPFETVFDSNLINALKTDSKFLKKNRFLALICRDTYFDKQVHLYGFEYANKLIQQGLVLRTVIVKELNKKQEGRVYDLWRYRALEKGFNLSNHEYIFIFEKV